MNLINKLFNRNGNTAMIANAAPINSSSPVTTMEDIVVDSNLFMDNQPPVLFEPKPTPEKEELGLSQFLKGDFLQRGKREGYELHDSESLENRLKQIRADYRLLADKLMERKQEELRGLRLQMLDIGDTSVRLKEQINISIGDMERTIEKLQQEKEWSAVDEGNIMVAIHAYRNGYLEGMEQYHSEKLLLSSGHIFNK